MSKGDDPRNREQRRRGVGEQSKFSITVDVQTADEIALMEKFMERVQVDAEKLLEAWRNKPPVPPRIVIPRTH